MGNILETRHPRDARIAVGTDSRVYRYGNYVVKEYPNLDCETLLSYQHLTNLMARSLQDRPLERTAIIEGKPWNIQFFVNPILDLNLGATPEARSPYIPGPNGFRMLGRTKRAMAGIMELEDKEEQEFFLQQLDLLTNVEYWKYLTNITEPSELVERVRQETGVENLTTIDRVNTKWRADSKTRRFSIYVTDLGSRISLLRFHPQML